MMAALQMLAFGVCTDELDIKFAIAESVTLECKHHFYLSAVGHGSSESMCVMLQKRVCWTILAFRISQDFKNIK